MEKETWGKISWVTFGMSLGIIAEMIVVQFTLLF